MKWPKPKPHPHSRHIVESGGIPDICHSEESAAGHGRTGWLNSLDTKVNAFVFNKLPVTVTVTVTVKNYLPSFPFSIPDPYPGPARPWVLTLKGDPKSDQLIFGCDGVSRMGCSVPRNFGSLLRQSHTVTVTDCLLKHELQKSSHPSPVVSRQLRRPVQSSPTWSVA